MASIHHLVKRPKSSIYHFRASIPTDLHNHLSKKQFEISLKTGIFRIAQSKARRLHHRYEELLNSYRSGSMPELTISLVKELLREELAKMYRHSEYIYTQTNRFNPEAVSSALAQVDKEETRFRQQLSADYHQAIGEIDEKIEALLQAHGLNASDKSSKEYLNLRNSLLELKQQGFQRRRALLKGEIESSWNLLNTVESEVPESGIIQSAAEPSSQHAPQPEPPSASTPAESLPSVLQNFIRMRKLGNDEFSPKRISTYESVVATLTEVCGTKSMESYTKADARQFLDTLTRLPSNRHKRPQYREQTIAEILKMSDVEPMSATTVNNQLSVITALFNWALQQGYVSSNIFTGMKLKQKRLARDERDAFSDEELKKIFNLKRLEQESLKKDKPAFYWVPLLGLYTGARLNELCQLHLTDVAQEGDIWYLDINDDTEDKRLKNLSSKRVIPLHPHLIQLGFIEFVQRQKQQKLLRVFSHLNPQRDGYTKNVSRFFNVRWLPLVGVKTKKNNFHSLRHTFTTKLKQALVPEQIASSFTGHSEQSITYSRYGKEMSLKTLHEAISQVKFL